MEEDRKSTTTTGRSHRRRARRRLPEPRPTRSRHRGDLRRDPPSGPSPNPDPRPVDAQGYGDHRAHQDRARARDPGRDRHAQAGADLRDPPRPRREGGVDLLGGRARSAARRLRLPARPRLQLPGRPRRHLRLPFANPQVRPAHRRHHLRADSIAEGRRTLLRADQGRGDQLRAARPRQGARVLREPDAALSRGAHPPRSRPREPVDARDGPDDAARQGPARPDRRAAAHRQDHAAAGDCQCDHHQSPRGLPDRAADRRAARKKSPTCSAR